MIIGLVTYGCVEPFDPQTVTFESALVIDATITNELKPQQIFLSRTFAFEEDVPLGESNATVSVADDVQNEYLFQETSPGVYVSVNPFGALPARNYQLHIKTDNGRLYSSTSVPLAPATQIDNVYAARITNDDGQNGMAIFVDSFDPTGNSRYYRYEFEETYKIIAPKWTFNDLVIVNGQWPNCEVAVVAREQEERVCYNTVESSSINVTNTVGLGEDRVSRFPVRFINSSNYILSHRYSILVKQFVQSNQAHTFFETLRDFSNTESLFSETQPGFLNGNVFSENNPDEKVLGYFDVSTVSEKRIFFDYVDFYPNEALPPYVNKCLEVAPELSTVAMTCPLIRQIEFNLVRYISDNSDPVLDGGPFKVVPRECGDCTALGEAQIPEFWVD